MSGMTDGAFTRSDAPDAAPAGSCRRCGYDLAGLPKGSLCPECGTAPADARPPRAARQAPAQRATPHPCRRCGYDLTGLPTGQRCPECGTPSPVRATRYAVNLVDAPLAYLRRLRLGMLMLAAATAGVLTIISSAFSGLAQALAPVAAAQMLGYSGLALSLVINALWLLGFWIILIPRAIDEHNFRDDILDSPRVRLACRIGAAAWPAMAAAILAAILLPASWSGPFAFLAAILAIVGLLALIPLSLYLGAIADWANAEWIGKATRGTVACLSIAVTLSVLSFVVGFIVPPAVFFFRLLASVLIFASLGMFAVSVLGLAGSCWWAVKNSVHLTDRDIRLAERLAEQRERDTAKEAQRQAALDAQFAAQAALATVGVPMTPGAPVAQLAPTPRPAPVAGAGIRTTPSAAPLPAPSPESPEEPIPLADSLDAPKAIRHTAAVIPRRRDPRDLPPAPPARPGPDPYGGI